MAFRKHCFKCGVLGHIAGECTSEHRLCYNCKKPGHESSACLSERNVVAKQCYRCSGVGHLQADCPNPRVPQAGGQKCYTCGRIGHIARYCTNGIGAGTGTGTGAGTGTGFASRVAPPSRGLNTSTLPQVNCYRCNGPNHLARDCRAAPGTTVNNTPIAPASVDSRTCYKCQEIGHIARECTV